MDEKYESLINLLKQLVKEAVSEVFLEAKVVAPSVDGLARRIAEINVKTFITVPEAGLLLRCSDSLLYKHIKAAQTGKTRRPIPYLDIDIYIFHRESLLQWAQGKDSYEIPAADSNDTRAA